jgi:DNA polymerase-4
MRERASGRDERPVLADVAEQQVSAEETFEQDLVAPEVMRTELARLADRVGTRLRRKSSECTTVSIKVRRADFSTYSRSLSFEPPTAETGAILGVATQLLERWRAEHPGARIRLLGVGVGGLAPATQMDLFAANGTSVGLQMPADPSRAQARLDPALDQIRARFGDTAVRRASTLGREDKNDGFTGVRKAPVRD